MKKSEKLKLEAQKEANDFKALGLFTKALREERIERFKVIWLPELEKITQVTLRDNCSYTFEDEKYGLIDFYPKANKLLIRKRNSWVKPGLEFIINNIIKTDEEK